VSYFSTIELSRAFGGVVAVDRASISIERGGIHALIGPNGCGKTTFFNLITGMVPADRGQIVFKGQDIRGARPHQVALAGIGRTFQLTRVFSRMTVLDNMLVAVRHTGLRGRMGTAVAGPDVERAELWLERLGIDHLRDAEARDLSYGQQKLLELGGVLMADPDFILLDEPAGGVNPVMIEKISRLVRELNAEGKTFFIVEHNMEMIMNLCHHVFVFQRGTPVAEGTPEEVRVNPKVLEAYLGE
jgi:ABC-type branched-subunit amino acid transport system ATPase component